MQLVGKSSPYSLGRRPVAPTLAPAGPPPVTQDTGSGSHERGDGVSLGHGEHRSLFTGDSIVLEKGEWVAALLNSSDRAEYIKSLELIRGLEFDVIVPWAASLDGGFYGFTDRSDIGRRIDEILKGMRRD